MRSGNGAFLLMLILEKKKNYNRNMKYILNVMKKFYDN